MPTIAKQYANVPIEELGLRHRIYKHLCLLNVRTVGDLFNLPEPVLRQYQVVLLEGIERVKRDHDAPII